MLDHLLQVGHRLLVVAHVDIVVCVGVVPVFHGAEVHRVAAHVADHVLGVVEPVQFRVAFRQPGLRQSALHGLGLIEAHHIREGGGGLVEGTFLELGLAQHHPRSPDEGVVLFPPEPLAVAGRLPLVALPFRLALDAVQADGLLALLYGTVVLALAYLAALLVAHHVEGEHLREVVLVALLLLQIAVDEGLRTVVVDVIAGRQRVIQTVRGGVLLHVAGGEEKNKGD